MPYLNVFLSYKGFAQNTWNQSVSPSGQNSEKLLKISVTEKKYFTQPDINTINRKRLNTLIIGGSTAYGLSMAGLYTVWYDKDEQIAFHFFNDIGEWKQMDKIGHFYSASQISRASAEAYRWAGLSEKKSRFWGMMTGIFLMTPIEILDGFSEEYGASWGDLLANTAGSTFFYGQYLLWEEQRIYPKFSFHQTKLASQRPEVLGKTLNEQFIKDYNGQTYWLSLDMDKFFKQKKFPKWLNVTVGYGADDMLFAQDIENKIFGIEPFRQYYLGLDFDLTAVRSKNKFVRTLLYLSTLIRLPAPALEWNHKQGWAFHFFYF